MTRHQLAKYIGTQVKAKRYERNFTQVDLARKSGVSQNFISNIENGTVSVNVYELLLVALALNVELQNLVPFTNILEGENEGDSSVMRSAQEK